MLSDSLNPSELEKIRQQAPRSCLLSSHSVLSDFQGNLRLGESLGIFAHRMLLKKRLQTEDRSMKLTVCKSVP